MILFDLQPHIDLRPLILIGQQPHIDLPPLTDLQPLGPGQVVRDLVGALSQWVVRDASGFTVHGWHGPDAGVAEQAPTCEVICLICFNPFLI